ncbi:MAG: hypothetical protein SW127_05020 [Actinomycetota bacterium]|nr:hypothetical protein [Actinomycetota bacterium]
MPFSDDDLEAFYREIEKRTDARGSGRRTRPEPPATGAGGEPSDTSAFTDSELESFYREVEARTAATPRRRPRRTAESKRSSKSCPTPDKVAFASDVLARQGIVAVRRHAGPGPTLRCYECVCGAWHITSRQRP